MTLHCLSLMSHTFGALQIGWSSTTTVEEDSLGMPEPLGQQAAISAFVDADHVGNKVTHRSHTGVLIIINNALITVFLKRQNTVELSTFGSELVAMRICCDLLVALRIKLKMFGVILDGPANVFCDNDGGQKNVIIPESSQNFFPHFL